MASEFPSVHNQSPSILVEHAVRCLTTERSTSCCVQRGYVKHRWDTLVKPCWVRETSSSEEIRRMENEVQEWELFHDCQTQTRTASDLRVCYLGELNLLNDLKLLIQNGILCRNIWVVVKDSNSHKKVWKSDSQWRLLRYVRLREDDFFSFLKDYRAQFDIIYFDPCASLAEENTLKVIGYVFYYNRLTSPGALITTFSFPPLMGYPLKQPVEHDCDDLGLELEHENETQGKSLFEQYLKCRGSQFDSTPLSERSDEENYGDYITYQVIDSATLFVPVERMLLSTPKPVWKEIFIDRGDFVGELLLEVIAQAKETGKSLGEQSEVPSEPSTLKAVLEQTAAESHPQKMGALLKSAERENSLCKTWIDEIFPDWRVSFLQKHDISLLLSTPLMFSSHKFIGDFFNSDFRRTCLDPIERGKSDCLNGPCTGCLVANLLYGQLANPSFPVMNKQLRLRYASKGKKVFSDVFIFDRCEYVYDQFPTVEGACHSIAEPMPQMVYRMAFDGLRKHLASVYASLFQFSDHICSGDPCSADDLLRPPKRQVLEGECVQSNEAAAQLDPLHEIESQLTKKAVFKEPLKSSFGGQPKIEDISLEDSELSDWTGIKGLVPPAVGCRGSKSIAAYKRALKNGKTMVLRGQVILIGATEAGKSSLLNVLHQKFNIDASLDEDELMALSETGFKFGASKYLVPSWELTESPTRPWEEWWTPSGSYMYWPTHLLKEKSATISSEEHPWLCGLCDAFHSVTEKVLWYFSSVDLDHELHPNFMPGEAIYVFVSDLSNAASMESSLDLLVRWMKSVYSSKDTCTENVSSSAHPSVILVGTHADKVVGDPLKPFNVILDRFRGEGLLQHVVDEKFIVDNTCFGQTQEDVSISRLHQKIISLASTLPLTKQEIPLQWLKVEKVLRCCKMLRYLTLQQFKSLVKRICHFEVDEDSHELLHFLCDCHVVTYGGTQYESSDLVILDPQWFIHMLPFVSCKKQPIIHTE